MPKLSDLKKQAVEVSNLLKLMSHPQRLLILCSLAEGEKTVGEIVKACGASQSAVSQFLKNMRLEGLVGSRREGQFVYYEIEDKQVLAVMRGLCKIFCQVALLVTV
jgi:ArsR family transcriptional regulator, virulence genes transcriptional regulator